MRTRGLNCSPHQKDPTIYIAGLLHSDSHRNRTKNQIKYGVDSANSTECFSSATEVPDFGAGAVEVVEVPIRSIPSVRAELSVEPDHPYMAVHASEEGSMRRPSRRRCCSLDEEAYSEIPALLAETRCCLWCEEGGRRACWPSEREAGQVGRPGEREK
jgi:hypothetical protein